MRRGTRLATVTGSLKTELARVMRNVGLVPAAVAIGLVNRICGLDVAHLRNHGAIILKRSELTSELLTRTVAGGVASRIVRVRHSRS